jgi:hypothetical protein
LSGQDERVSEPPTNLSKDSPDPEDLPSEGPGTTSELPAPTRAAGTEPETATPGSTSPATGSASGGRSIRQGARKVLFITGGVVALVVVIVILVLVLGGGDGTKQTANPLEVRQLVATFNCTPSNPGTPSAIKVTAGQEVVQLGRGGCAVVGPVIDSINRATKVSTTGTSDGCTVTFQSTAKYGGIVDRASVVNNGYARALVAGGYILDLRARLYAPTQDEKLSVVFNASNQAACTKVADALKRS